MQGASGGGDAPSGRDAGVGHQARSRVVQLAYCRLCQVGQGLGLRRGRPGLCFSSAFPLLFLCLVSPSFSPSFSVYLSLSLTHSHTHAEAHTHSLCLSCSEGLGPFVLALYPVSLRSALAFSWSLSLAFYPVSLTPPVCTRLVPCLSPVSLRSLSGLSPPCTRSLSGLCFPCTRSFSLPARSELALPPGLSHSPDRSHSHPRSLSPPPTHSISTPSASLAVMACASVGVDTGLCPVCVWSVPGLCPVCARSGVDTGLCPLSLPPSVLHPPPLSGVRLSSHSVCPSVCLSVHTRIRTSVYLSTHVCLSVCLSVHTPIRAHAHARTRTRTHAHARTHTHAHTHARTHARAHTRARTHTRARHTHTHTHTHAHAHARAHTHARTHTHRRAGCIR